MAESSIQWTDATWNPTSGCTKISPGCAHCYIERTPPMRMAGRKFVGGKIPLELHEDRLVKPLHWKNPRRIFVNSMSDPFHEDVPDEFIDKVFAVMALCRQHTFQVLTKRAERMQRYLSSPCREDAIDEIACDMRDEVKHWVDFAVDYVRLGRGGFVEMPLDNVWLGVSVEDQQRADERIPLLLQTPAAVRFLSVERLLGSIDLTRIVLRKDGHFPNKLSEVLGDWVSPLTGPFTDSPRIHWIIVGAESGHGARRCNLDDIRSIVVQCKAANVACFVKQLGADPYVMTYKGNGRRYSLDEIRAGGDAAEEAAEDFEKILNGAVSLKMRDRKGGDMAEFPEDLRVREFPTVEAAR